MGKRRTPVSAYKKLLEKDKDWDYCYLLMLEKKKLQRMYNYFSTSEIAYSDEFVARDLRICIKLIDIIMAHDAAYKTWLHESSKDHVMHTRKKEDGLYQVEFEQLRPDTDFQKYVNVRNAKRFIGKPLDKEEFSTRSYISEKVSLRLLKALHLYNLIREYNMLGWYN